MEETEIENWDDLDLNTELLRGIYAYGFEKPSPIQKKACIHFINGRDILAQAQSGTGKTGAFVVGSLSRINTDLNQTQVLILNPTRELALQTLNVIQELGAMVKGLRSKILVGGTSSEIDTYEIKRTIPHIITGTPGRVYEMIKRRIIVPGNIKLIVLDEADEMFSFGFKDQVFEIFQSLKDVQIALFSATMPQHVLNISTQLLKNPVSITVKAEDLALDGISQYVVFLDDDKQKFSTLQDLFERLTIAQTIIYCNSVGRVVDLYEAMKNDEFPVCCIHSNMDKQERELSFEEFKNGKYRVLISSNVTARGIDIQQVSIVINFDLPRDPHTYLHRIGRSGRWGRKGIGINFVTKRDSYNLKLIEGHYDKKMEELPMHFEQILH